MQSKNSAQARGEEVGEQGQDQWTLQTGVIQAEAGERRSQWGQALEQAGPSGTEVAEPGPV